MKKRVDQGLAVSKDLAARAGEKAQELGEKGYAASKNLAAKAGEKAKGFGERGVLTLEIKQLEGQVKKLILRLGTEADKAFMEKKAKTLSANTAAVKAILTELEQTRQSLEEKKAELKKKKAG
jgi:hypothetical protein